MEEDSLMKPYSCSSCGLNDEAFINYASIFHEKVKGTELEHNLTTLRALDSLRDAGLGATIDSIEESIVSRVINCETCRIQLANAITPNSVKSTIQKYDPSVWEGTKTIQ